MTKLAVNPLQAIPHKAARVSWMVPLCGGIAGTAVRSSAGGMVASLLTVALVLVGFAISVFALTGIRKHGKKGILVPACFGLAMCCVVMVDFVMNRR